MKSSIGRLLNRLPYVRKLIAENLKLKKNFWVPAGHFYSPFVLGEEIKSRDEIWNQFKKDGILEIDLNAEEQLKLMAGFSRFYGDLPFKQEENTVMRYYFNNEYYSYSDAIILYSMMRHLNPKRIVEVGSGFSSAVMLDTNSLYFDHQIQLTFIDPFPDRLYSLMQEKDYPRSEIIQKDVQSVPLETFKVLQAGDILFIDSTHVVKTGSDLNYILFQILPVLATGVSIHFHDIFYPFEYPKEWVLEGRNWNENYFLRAFLMHNNKYKITLFSHYLHLHHPEAFSRLPLCYEGKGGCLWLLKC